ncbi:hypothetical protein K8942_04615 [Candidatus Peribacteria bacterium]|nr:MAG: hypothetical protein K8942_04615 [Candidatus Peribacteria bacterium]
MKPMMTTRQIVDAIHEGIPKSALTMQELAAPPKGKTGNNLAHFFQGLHSIKEDPRFAITPEKKDALRAIVENATSIRQLIDDLRMTLNQPFHDMVVKVINQHITEDGQEFAFLAADHWGRLEVALPGSNQNLQKTYPDIPEKWHTVALVQIILGGIQNVTHGDLAGILCVPELFKETKQEIVKPKTWEHIADSMLPLLLDITSSEQDVFDYGIGYAMKHKNTKPTAPLETGLTNFNFPGYDVRALRLNEELEICLHPRIIKSTQKRVRQKIEQGLARVTGDRHGCPGRPLFGLIHRRIMSMAPEVIFPHAEHILSLPME